MFMNDNPAVERSGLLSNLDVRPLMRTVYLWMTIALTITGVIAMVLANQFTTNIESFITIANLMLPIILVQFGLVLGISFLINKINPTVAIGLFLFYAVTMGVTISVIIFSTIASPEIGRNGQIVADWSIVYKAFFTTAGLFGTMTVIGYTTKVDLTRFSSFFMMALIGLVIATVVNIFLRSDGLSFIISIAGVLIFTALTAYDTQRIKQMAESELVQEGTADFTRLAIIGALTLYLDFVNIFLYLLRLFGSRD
jgi:FtsH-binding integral membrane protein